MKIIGMTLIALSMAVLFIHFAGEFAATDMCQDAGKIYDYATSQCRADVEQLPYIPYVKRFSWFIVGGLVAMLVGVVCFVVGRGRTNESTF